MQPRFRARYDSRDLATCLPAVRSNAIHRSPVNRLWSLRRVRFLSCGTVAFLFAYANSPGAVSDANSHSRAESCTDTNSSTRAVTNADANTASAIHTDRRRARRRNPHSNRWRGSGGFSWRQYRSRDQDRLGRNLPSGRVGGGCNDHAGFCGRLYVADRCRSGVEGRYCRLRSRQVIRLERQSPELRSAWFPLFLGRTRRLSTGILSPSFS